MKLFALQDVCERNISSPDAPHKGSAMQKFDFVFVVSPKKLLDTSQVDGDLGHYDVHVTILCPCFKGSNFSNDQIGSISHSPDGSTVAAYAKL